MDHTVLFVDDEPDVTDGLKRKLRKEPYRILRANSADDALNILESEKVDVVVSDEQMPGMKGSEFLAVVRQKYPGSIRMILTGHASLDAAVKAVNEGRIYRFLIKPCNDAELAVTIRQALRQKDLMREAYQLLQISKKQASMLEKLEKDHPELVIVKRDDDGVIAIDDSTQELDAEKIIREIAEQNKNIK